MTEERRNEILKEIGVSFCEMIVPFMRTAQLKKLIDRTEEVSRRETKYEASDAVAKLMREYANTPIKERTNAWDWLVRARKDIETL